LDFSALSKLPTFDTLILTQVGEEEEEEQKATIDLPVAVVF